MRFSASTRSSMTRLPPWSSTAVRSPPRRRSASAGASTASARSRSRPGNCPSRRSPGAWREGGLTPDDLDAVAYSYDPALVDPDFGRPRPRAGKTCAPRTRPGRPSSSRPLCPATQGQASTSSGTMSPTPPPPRLAAPWGPDGSLADCAVLVADGRGEATSMLAGEYRDRKLDLLQAQALPHSLGLLYEDLTAHLGFERSSDEYKVMAMASYGEPRHLDQFRAAGVRDGGRRLPHRASRLARLRTTTSAGRRSSTSATPTWRPACRRFSKRCCSISATGCTAAPEAAGSP